MIATIINIVCIFNLTLLVTLLVLRRNNSYANLFLAGVIFTSLVALAGNYTMYEITPIYALYKKIEMGPAFLFGIFLWAHITSILGVKIKTNKKILLHFVPAFIMLGIGAKDFLLSKADQNTVIREISNGSNLEYNILNLLFVCHTFGYILYLYFAIKRYASSAIQYYPATDFIKINYARQLINVLIVLNLAGIVIYTMPILFPQISAKTVEMVFIPIVVDALNIFIVYKAFSNSAILSKNEIYSYSNKLADFNSFREENSNEKYKGIHLSKETEEDYYNTILRLLEKEKVYLKEDLNLKSLSTISSIPIHQLSHTINTRFHKNFSDLINQYRIEETKRLMVEKPQYTIEAIAFEAGFNSKTTFNRSFKKFTGTTPSEYIKAIPPNVMNRLQSVEF